MSGFEVCTQVLAHRNGPVPQVVIVSSRDACDFGRARRVDLDRHDDGRRLAMLLPATMKLLGRWNRYLPRWLEWLPHLEYERSVDACTPARGYSP